MNTPDPIKENQFIGEVWSVLKSSSNDLRKQGSILRLTRAYVEALLTQHKKVVREEMVTQQRKAVAALVKKFADRLIDISLSNEPMRGAVTSNQIIDARDTFWTETHEELEALTPPTL